MPAPPTYARPPGAFPQPTPFQGWLQEPPASPEQLERIEEKLDQVLDALAPLSPYAPRPGELERLMAEADGL